MSDPNQPQQPDPAQPGPTPPGPPPPQPQYGQQPPQYGQPQYGAPQYPPPGQPPYGAPQYPQQPGYPPPGQPYGSPPPPAYPYASWWSRVGAYLLDRIVVPLPGYLLAGLGAFIAFKDARSVTTTYSGDYYYDSDSELTNVNGVGIAIMVAGILLALALLVWNMVFRQGNTGQTLGKKWLSISVVREADGRPLGPGMAFVRWLLLWILGDLCFLNFLWPLWDPRHRCWHDMLVTSVVIKGAVTAPQ
ncbi:RDD family protein [Rhodococcus sp. MTM3W5.2]|uniref:RDD family protein n=1 Tax=Rhodococcus sp. MTM3W5.2 TaxID=1805827 RepID=UPI0009797878|nr:RDD family protein [Rhodococcus sp. MTM3W5.2]AQA24180.1 RDD family protein [Rhodococcus sp. MTM3W5.2]